MNWIVPTGIAAWVAYLIGRGKEPVPAPVSVPPRPVPPAIPSPVVSQLITPAGNPVLGVPNTPKTQKYAEAVALQANTERDVGVTHASIPNGTLTAPILEFKDLPKAKAGYAWRMGLPADPFGTISIQMYIPPERQAAFVTYATVLFWKTNDGGVQSLLGPYWKMKVV